ncbi:MAG: helix-turn-helix transcriptional regulator [Deltaproteobacteria bacterium]|nr:helix-turn-helix transcriptional regulator [Deltaproteobacteria bacterium]
MPAKKGALPFGKRVMRLRREKNMTLKTLANETGLSELYLSQVEKGEVIPPVAVILQLSRALEIDSSILLREEKAKAGKDSESDYRKRTEDYSYQTLTPEAAHKRLKAFKVFIDPKSDHKGVSYQHLGEEFIYVLKGKINVMVGENKNTLSPGECIHFNSSIIHKLRNISEEKAELLVVLYTP